MAPQLPPIHDPNRTATRQGEIRAARRKQYYNMTSAEIVRSLTDSEVNRYARRGARDAILEQSYRQNIRDAWDEGNDELSDFERQIMVEGGI